MITPNLYSLHSIFWACYSYGIKQSLGIGTLKNYWWLICCLCVSWSTLFQSDLLPPPWELVLHSHKCIMFLSTLGNIMHLCEWGTSCEGGAISCCVGEHSVNHGWLCTGEDMYKAPWFCNSYEIVRKAHFNSNKATKVHLSNIFIHQTLQNTHSTSCSSSLQYIAVHIHTQLFTSASSSTSLPSFLCSTHLLQHTWYTHLTNKYNIFIIYFHVVYNYIYDVYNQCMM